MQTINLILCLANCCIKKKRTNKLMNYLNLDWCYSPDSEGCACQIGNWTAIAWQTEKKDWNYYSKAWHRNHGPKVIVTGRYVRFTSLTGKTTKTVSLDSWRGNWQAKALIEAGLVKPRRGKMHIRLNPAFDIKLVSKKRGYLFYKRTLKGEFVDYCLVSPMGMTYHAADFKACLAGLKAKRKAMKRREIAIINWSLLKSLGFCSAGVKEFCSVFGFDVNESYTPDEVYETVIRNPEQAAPFAKELKILADCVCYNAPELQ